MQHLDHSTHDVTLIAGHAAADLVDSERTRAVALLDACSQCTELHRDLIAIAAATRSLPTLATAAAPRDFRLAPEQAARLRRGSWLRTILAPFASPGSATRPLAAAFTSLGVAGLLVATVLPGLFGSAASLTPERNQATSGGGPAIAAPTSGPVAPAGGPGETAARPDGNVDNQASGDAGGGFGVKDGASPSSGAHLGATSSGAPEVAVVVAGKTGIPDKSGIAGEAVDAPGRTIGATPPSLLLTGSLALLAVGLLLFAVYLGARRLRI